VILDSNFRAAIRPSGQIAAVLHANHVAGETRTFLPHRGPGRKYGYDTPGDLADSADDRTATATGDAVRNDPAPFDTAVTSHYSEGALHVMVQTSRDRPDLEHGDETTPEYVMSESVRGHLRSMAHHGSNEIFRRAPK
jgi:hypothetical protein